MIVRSLVIIIVLTGVFADQNFEPTANLTDEIELEIRKPLSISREQFVRFRKFLTKKGITAKNAEDDASGEQNKMKSRYSISEKPKFLVLSFIDF